MGLYFAQARQYDAGVGWFASEDRVRGFIALPSILNAYNYCISNPLVNQKISGEQVKLVKNTKNALISGVTALELIGNKIAEDYVKD